MEDIYFLKELRRTLAHMEKSFFENEDFFKSNTYFDAVYGKAYAVVEDETLDELNNLEAIRKDLVGYQKSVRIFDI